MTYEDKVKLIKLLQQLDASCIPIATTVEAGEDRYGDRIGANASVCRAGKRALLVVTPKSRLDGHDDGFDCDEDDSDRDDFEGEDFFDDRPQFIYCGIHEFDWEALTSTAASELKRIYGFLDVSEHRLPEETAVRDAVGILSKILDLRYRPKPDHQFGPPSKILKAWLCEGLNYSETPGFGYLDGKLFLFDGKVMRTGMFNGAWRGDQALATALNWLVRTECIDISAYKSLPFPENLRATIRSQDQSALLRQIATVESAVRHAEAELNKKRLELEELRQKLGHKL